MFVSQAFPVWFSLGFLLIQTSTVFHTVSGQNNLLRCRCSINRDRSTSIDISCSRLKIAGRLQCNKVSVRDSPSGYQYMPPWGLVKLYRSHLTSDGAKAVCARHGGRLAIPKDGDAAALLGKMVKDEPGVDVAFVGIHDIQTEGHFYGVDGSKATYQEWRVGEPPHGSGDDTCVAMTDDGRLDGLKCEVQAPFLCERPQQNAIPSGYQYVAAADAFLRLYSSARVAYSYAQKVCGSDGGSLAVPDTWQRAEAMARLIPPDTGFVFVGLTDEEAEGDFVTNDNTRRLSDMEYALWGPDEPDNGGGKAYEDCMALHANGTLHDVVCRTEQAFLCEIQAP